MKVVAVIPARLDSKRLPRKVLRDLAGKPVVRQVYERVSRATHVGEVWVATDSEEVARACEAFDARVFRSKMSHKTGTDRVAEVARSIDADLFVNVQSDEPMMDPDLIDHVIELFEDPSVHMASAAAPIKRLEDYLDPNIVKVVCDERWDALYFSRASIPWTRDVREQGGGSLPEGSFAHKHIGVYIYRKECLLSLASSDRTPLEVMESLEQLRAQENGWKIRILEWDYRGIDIDTEEELERVRAILEDEAGNSPA